MTPPAYTERPVDLRGHPVPDCARGIHVARLGGRCVCGDPGPPLTPLRALKVAPATTPEAKR